MERRRRVMEKKGHFNVPIEVLRTNRRLRQGFQESVHISHTRRSRRKLYQSFSMSHPEAPQHGLVVFASGSLLGGPPFHESFPNTYEERG